MEKTKLIDGGYPDFILCMGNTSKDEEMFTKLEQFVNESEDVDVS